VGGDPQSCSALDAAAHAAAEAISMVTDGSASTTTFAMTEFHGVWSLSRN
jgi:hypothetical protein